MLVPMFLRSREQTFLAFLSRAASTIVSTSCFAISSSSFFLDFGETVLAGTFFISFFAHFAFVFFAVAFFEAPSPFFLFDVAVFTVFSAFSSFSFLAAVLFLLAATLLVSLAMLFLAGFPAILAEVFALFSVTSVILTISLCLQI